MTPTLKAIFQYIIILAVTVLLTWLSLRNLDISTTETGYNTWTYLIKTWQDANKNWLMLMAVFAMASHILRAERWKMLMKPSGNETRLSYSFLSLMVGYLVNLVIPRGGEISRCYNLYKLDKTPVEVSFGTVITERVVDVVCLLTLVVLAFIVESKKLLLFVESLPFGSDRLYLLLYFAISILFLGAVFWLFYKKSTRVNLFINKTWKGVREGLLSVFKLERKALFIFYSVVIWALYFIMSYTVIQAFPETSHLGMTAVLSLFAIGSIAMAAPLPGGTGSYHLLVPQGLIFLYSIPANNAFAFTVIFHGWQTLIMIAGGAISLIVTLVIVKKNSVKT